ncbi:hypothetical protein LSH36_202g09082 [Paralvinella palmiformis]|uniref:Uncharacterized protein n=1 Tax=Paralvinella palmiformis TaxID=53620 RepID=A0AAD9JPK8_9ANNE|nr:hypothetical protein LSH36_202g09082 [Paralvinella palmiformis]
MANAFKINNMEYKFYETLVNMRLKQYKILLKTYNRLMCERTSFQAVEYCAWWNELYPEEPCVPPVIKQIQINFTTCDLPPIEPITYTE